MGNGEFFSKPESWLAIVTAGTALVAIWQTRKQIGLSNKQQLFDRRLEKYKLICEILDMYERNRDTFLREEKIYDHVSAYLPWLMEISLFESSIDILFNAWTAKDQERFLLQLDKLEKSAFEIELLWKKRDSKVFREMLLQYCHLLKLLYKQYSFSSRASVQFKKDYGNEFVKLGYEEYEKEIKENAEKIKLSASIKQFDNTYTTIISKKCVDKLFAQTKLYRR